MITSNAPTRISAGLLIGAWTARLLLWLVLAAWLLFTVTWAALQVWIVPRIGDYRVQMETQASKALGIPVRIGAVQAQSDGLIPSFELHDVSLLDAQGREALHLPLVIASLSPQSLWHKSFEQLTLERPVLDIRRVANGHIEVAGLDFTQSASVNGSAADWFFSQRAFTIREGTVRWTDEQPRPPPSTSGKRQRLVSLPPPLALEQLELAVRNTPRSHELRLAVTPPTAWGSRFSVTGQFKQSLLSPHPGDWREWSGPVFANFESVDISQLKSYLQWDLSLSAGRGALRTWLDMAKGRIQGITADLALAEVAAQWNPDLAPLDLLSLTGRLEAHRTAQGLAFSTQRLQFASRDGLQWPAGDVQASLVMGSTTLPIGGELHAEHIDLASAMQIAAHLPLSTATHSLLASYAARGTLESLHSHWQGPVDALRSFDAQGRVSQLALSAQRSSNFVGVAPALREAPGRPGLRGATLDFQLNQKGGSAKLGIEQGALEFPGIFDEPLVAFQELKTELQWKLQGDKIEVVVPSLRIDNADAQGELKANWHSSNTTPGNAASRFPGVLDLQGRFSRLDGSKVHRYLPTIIPSPTRDYLRAALLACNASDIALRLRGDLRDFPFEDPRKGEFTLAAKINNAHFAYAPSKGTATTKTYPALQQLSGDLLIDRNSLDIRNAYGRLAAAPALQISQLQAHIPDLSHSTTVVLTAQANGPLADMLGVVNASPLADITGRALSSISATGDAELKLRLHLPVLTLERSKVQGSLTLSANDVRMLPSLPLFTQARGVLAFNETGLGTVDLRAGFLGGDTHIESAARSPSPSTASATDASTEPSLQLRAQGNAAAEGLRQAAATGPLAALAKTASGLTNYTANFSLRRGIPEITVSSNLQGLALSLPEPFGKSAESVLALRFENSLLKASLVQGQKLQDQILLDLGKTASLVYQRDLGNPAEPRVLRGAIAVGLAPGESAPLPSEGVVANINAARIDVDAWENLLAVPAESKTSAPANKRARSNDAVLAYLPSSIALRTEELRVDQHQLKHVVVGGSRDALTWRANIEASELNGYLEYRQPSGAGAGRLYARLARLEINPSNQSNIETVLSKQPANVPALDIVVDDLQLRGKRLGRVEIDAVNRNASGLVPEGTLREWRLNRLNMSMPEGTLTASGNWAAIGITGANAANGSTEATNPGTPPNERRRSVMNFRLDIADAGEMLKRFGQAGVLRRGKGKLEGQISWLGSPLALDYPSLSGQVNVNVESGQFLKADPGIAKLLGVLSLQSLPRRLALDFRDVFSEGFAFDFIRGDAHIEQGLAQTQNLQMKGVAAVVLMEGTADLARETQDLKVVIVPEINAGTASIVASIINPAIGVGTFLAQLFLRRPLIQANTQELHIDGGWADPRITKIDRKAASGAANPASAPAAIER